MSWETYPSMEGQLRTCARCQASTEDWGHTNFGAYSIMCVACRNELQEQCPRCGRWVKKGGLRTHMGRAICQTFGVRKDHEDRGLKIVWNPSLFRDAGVSVVSETLAIPVEQHFVPAWARGLYLKLHKRLRDRYGNSYLPAGAAGEIRRQCVEILAQCMKETSPEQHAARVAKMMELGE